MTQATAKKKVAALKKDARILAEETSRYASSIEEKKAQLEANAYELENKTKQFGENNQASFTLRGQVNDLLYQKQLNEENLKVNNIENIKDKNEFIKIRAENDSEALKRRFSNKSIFEKNVPSNHGCQSLYKLSEKIRYEMLGSEMLIGISKNFQNNYSNKLKKIDLTKIKKKDDVNISDAFEIYMLDKFLKVQIQPEAQKILSFWERELRDTFDKHITYLNKNLENQEIYNSKFSEILENMEIFDNEENDEKKETQEDNNQDNSSSNNQDDNDSDSSEDKKYQRFFYQESFRNLFTSIKFMGSESSLRTIVLTSTEPSEGKSLISIMLCKTLSEIGQKILLIDCDLRKPQLHKRLITNI